MDLANLAESDLQRTLQKYDQLKPDQVRRTHQAPAGGQSFLIRDRKHYELRAIASILQEETGLAVELSSAETHLAAHLETMGNVVVRTPEKPAKVIGDIPGITTGHRFRSRREAHVLGAHRALQAGITGNREHGAESIVASDGYEDDEDYKTWLIYTGHGGRGGTGHQFGDQSFGAPGNAALRFSQLTGSPVRVIRGANPKSQNQHLPKTGLRYDGLYLVEDSWSEPGKSGNKSGLPVSFDTADGGRRPGRRAIIRKPGGKFTPTTDTPHRKPGQASSRGAQASVEQSPVHLPSVRSPAHDKRSAIRGGCAHTRCRVPAQWTRRSREHALPVPQLPRAVRCGRNNRR